MRKIFFSFLALAFACSAMAVDSAEVGAEYSADGYKVHGLASGKVAVTTVYLADEATEVVIPASVHATWKGGESCDLTFEVEQVGYNDGANDWNLYVERNSADAKTIYTSVKIDNGVQRINAKTFEGASALKYLTLPASITEIGAYAFQNCDALEGVWYNGKDALPTIGEKAFEGSSSWDKIYANCKVYVLKGSMISATQNGEWTVWKGFTDKSNMELNKLTLKESEYWDFLFYNECDVNVTIDRSFAADQWHTLCVPFDMNATNLKAVFGEEVEVAYLSGSSLAGNDLTLNFQTLDLTGDDYAQACAPYLVKPSQNVAAGATFWSVYFDNSQSKINETTNAKFIGSFETKNLTADQYFMGNDNNLYTHAGVEMKGYRAYFEFNGSVPANVRARVVMQPRQTTAIGNVQESEPSTKVIENGHLYILKNGVRYNAQGQIVK